MSWGPNLLEQIEADFVEVGQAEYCGFGHGDSSFNPYCAVVITRASIPKPKKIRKGRNKDRHNARARKYYWSKSIEERKRRRRVAYLKYGPKAGRPTKEKKAADSRLFRQRKKERTAAIAVGDRVTWRGGSGVVVDANALSLRNLLARPSKYLNYVIVRCGDELVAVKRIILSLDKAPQEGT
jgi:hypothetical protein